MAEGRTKGRLAGGLRACLLFSLVGLVTMETGCVSRPSRHFSARDYVPVPGVVQRGYASWYGAKYKGRRTASGEKFNPYDLTAAHRTWPFGTVVEVRNLRNGRKVLVQINDRGPFVAGRIIDLSEEAATELGIVAGGVAPVEIRPMRAR